MSERTFAPAPGSASVARMLSAQTAMELRETLRNGEQLLLMLIIPVLLLVGFSTMPLINMANLGGAGSRVAYIAPGVIALAIMSTAFTGQAIKTGFERRYGVLKRLGATPLPRWGLLGAKTLTVIVVELGQLVVLAAVAVALGWRPRGAGTPEVLLLLLLGTATFSGLGLLMAGTLRAEATLAGANLVYLVFLGLGGVLFPITEFPNAMQPVLMLLPITALTDGLRQVLQYGAVLPARDVIVLTVWAVAALSVASMTFKWE